MAIRQHRDIGSISPAYNRSDGIALSQAGLQHQLIAPVKSGVGQGQLAQAVGVMGIDTGVVQHQIGNPKAFHSASSVGR